MLLLTAVLLAVQGHLRQPRRIQQTNQLSGYSLELLALRNASRNPLRSTLSIGLMATASFLIIAINAFQLQPTDRGTGGFEMIAQSAQPIFQPLGDPAVRRDLMAADASELSGTTIASFRMRAGQDASCNNLYRASQPTVLGVPKSFDSLFKDPRHHAWIRIRKIQCGDRRKHPLVFIRPARRWNFDEPYSCDH